MKVKLAVSRKNYEKIEGVLAAHGIEIDDDAELILSENNAFTDFLTVKKDDALYRINIEEVIFIESLAHDVLVHTTEGVFKTQIRLWKLENMLDPQLFMRISNSVIVAKKSIKSIKPALSQKFVLVLTDKSIVDVTRSYYYIFKEKIRI